jgi:hypothetical protein
LGLRLRGNGHRRLYAFRQNPDEDQVRTRHLAYKLSDGIVHKLDIIGLGGQYVISGLHNNGKDHYTWDDAAPFNDDICEIGNGDIDRFIDRLKEILVKKGGELIKVTGASQAYSERDLHEMDPVLPVDAILEGLKKVPNTPENSPSAIISWGHLPRSVLLLAARASIPMCKPTLKIGLAQTKIGARASILKRFGAPWTRCV